MEKPSVRKIKYAGNHIYEDQEIADVVRTGTGSILNLYRINEDIERIKSLYTEKNYHNCEVTYTSEMLDNNQADISFNIEEGDKLKVKQILFEGNKFFQEKEIKDVIKTDEKGFFTWITSSGELDKNELEQDVYRIEALYKNNGFIDARISDPEVIFEKDHILIRFKIQEGDQYKVGSVNFNGDLIVSEDRLMQTLKMKTGDLYSREKLRTNLFAITDIYMDKGFANADIVPAINKDDESKVVDITFQIEKGSPVYIERILISGNSKTRDKVIRRQLAVYEQQLYSMSGIQRSVKNLQRIDYFENVDIKTSKGSREDMLNLDVEITEKATGAFSFGGGYSSEDSLFGMISVSERNFRGKGQILSAKAEVSSSSTRFTLSFTEPWLFDIPLSFGIDAYNWDKEYDYYDKDSKGGAIRLGYMIFDYTSAGIRYGYEDFTIDNVNTDFTEVDEGQYVTSSITTSIGYDSRNRPFNPTEGSDHSLSVEYAGGFLGGEIDFTKYIAETGWYYPLFWKFTGFLHGKAGFLDDRSRDDIEIDYERFYLGGINSVRGYEWQDINATPENEDEERGGEKFIQFNAEIIFPILEDINLSGVIFYDMGDAYTKDEDMELEDLYSSFGGGFRWYSPMGPIRIEYGQILNGNEYSGGRWEFSMGAAF
ncbi:Outer membrane protein (Putative surface antigen) (fragment) [Desulfamplus magnetovallimortis]|uniref:Outer membrane protein assembly factor BamA n=1 Tax=Desulfamplus magnetovallimortis TaxID=1246637 RepID=A0A1W1H500_9BACT